MGSLPVDVHAEPNNEDAFATVDETGAAEVAFVEEETEIDGYENDTESNGESSVAEATEGIDESVFTDLGEAMLDEEVESLEGFIEGKENKTVDEGLEFDEQSLVEESGEDKGIDGDDAFSMKEALESASDNLEDAEESPEDAKEVVATETQVVSPDALWSPSGTSSNWVWPVDNDGQCWWNWPKYNNKNEYHSGVDMPTNGVVGKKVYSSCDGYVDRVRILTNTDGSYRSYGKYVVIRGTVDGLTRYFYYAHLDSFNCSEGQAVKAGDIIAYSGNTGNSSGPHLHYEVRNEKDAYGNINNPTLNPKDYLPGSSKQYELIGQQPGGDTCNCSDSYAGDYVVTTNSSPLTIRSGHGTGFSKIGEIPKGATCHVSKGDGTWAHVEYNGVNGYASMQYLARVSSSSTELDYRFKFPFSYQYRGERLFTYDAAGGARSGYVDDKDDCTVNEVYASGWIKVTFPNSSTGGTLTRYSTLTEFLGGGVNPVGGIAPQYADAYYDSARSARRGYVDAGDEIVKLREENGSTLVQYPVGSEWRCAWVETDLLKKPKPGASTISAKAGYNGTASTFTWSSASNTDYYNFYIWSGTEAQVKNTNAWELPTQVTSVRGTSLTASYTLGPGWYKTYVDSVNEGGSQWTCSNQIAFNIPYYELGSITLSQTTYTFDGNAKTPGVTVKNANGVTLGGSDYTVSYLNNVNAGTATVTVTGKGNYSGTKSVSFTINPAQINSVTLSQTSYTYDGSAKTPGVTVKAASGATVPSSGYNVTYSNNTNVGTATCTVTGKGNYSGSKSASFTIKAAAIASVTLSQTSYTYDGSAKTPSVTVKVANGATIASSGYNVSYANNTNIGTAICTVTGKGNYAGSISVNYSIVAPEKVIFDINGYLDGSGVDRITGYGTVDLYINGSRWEDNCSDYCQPLSVGTKYEIKDIRPADGKEFVGYKSGSPAGTLGNDRVNANLEFRTIQVTASDVPVKTQAWNGHTYMLFESNASWHKAKLVCERNGGHLATVSSAEEDAFLTSFAGQPFWLGATDIDAEGTWKWVTGEEYEYSHFDDGEPNNDSWGIERSENYLGSRSGKWNDYQGYTELAYVCEIDTAALLDLNGKLDGKNQNYITGYGTADVYINGKQVSSGSMDYYAWFPVGTAYEFKNIKALEGKEYVGCTTGNLSGTLKEGSTNVQLEFRTKAVNVEYVSLNKTSLSLAKGKSEMLRATVAPENATDKTVIWSSSDALVATVDGNGKVTAVKAGTSTVKATSSNGLYASCTVTVTAPTELKITRQPQDCYATVGEKASVSLAASGDGLSYQWYVKNKSSSSFAKSSIAKAAYSVTMSEAIDGRQLYCIVTDQYGNSVTSNMATLHKFASLSITGQPQDCYAANGEKANVTVTATGTGLKYQWYLKNKSATKFAKSSVTKNVYSVAMSDTVDGRQVYCVITDQKGDSITSEVATLHKYIPLSITGQPQDCHVANGKKASATVTAMGTGLKYQWYLKNRNASSYSKSSVTSNTYSTTMSDTVDGRRVYCVVTDQKGNSVTSEVATLHKFVALAITGQPQDCTVSNGEKATTSVTATGTGLTYQWYVKNRTSSTFTKSSVTKNIYSVTMSDTVAGRQVYCVVTDQAGNSIVSNTATLNQAQPLSITTQPKDSYAYNGEKATVKVVASGSGLKYQWYLKNKNGTKFSLSSVSSNTYSVTMSDSVDGRQVYCIVTDQKGNMVISNTVTLNKYVRITIVSLPQNVTVANGKKASTMVKATGSGLTYQWYVKNKKATSFTKSSVTKDTYSVTMSDTVDGRQVYCVITDVKGITVQTNTVTLSKK